MIEVSGVSRAFVTPSETVRAVNDVSFTARAGEVVCLFGPSGSGKSTLLALIAGLDVPDAGTITVAGQSVHDLDEQGRARLRRDTVGVVFQHDHLIDEFTALENVCLPLELRGGRPGSPAVVEQAQYWLERVGLAGLDGRRPDELSGGQQQRVGIARALVGGRRILVADEPTGALDSTNSAALYALVRELAADGVTVLVSSHDHQARDLADQTLELIDGRLADSVRG